MFECVYVKQTTVESVLGTTERQTSNFRYVQCWYSPANYYTARHLSSSLDGTDRDDFEVELPICPLSINSDLCDRAFRLAARANLRVLRRAEHTQDV